TMESANQAADVFGENGAFVGKDDPGVMPVLLPPLFEQPRDRLGIVRDYDPALVPGCTEDVFIICVTVIAGEPVVELHRADPTKLEMSGDGRRWMGIKKDLHESIKPSPPPREER